MTSDALIAPRAALSSPAANRLGCLALAMLAATTLLAGCGGDARDPGPAAAPPVQTTPPVQASPQEPGVPVSAPAVPASAPADLVVGYAAQRYDFSWSPVAGATYYQVQEDPDGSGPVLANQVGADVGVTALQYTVALHLRLNASYTVRACNASGCGPASAQVVPDPTKAIGQVKAPGPATGDLFGAYMALSADGTTLAVAATQEASNATGIDGDQADDSAPAAGAVYVYTRTNGAWVQQAYVKASNTEAGDWFGSSVALSADGTSLAVGAPGEDSSAHGVDVGQSDNSAVDTGAVYVYARTNGAWAQQAYVKGSTAAGSYFGTSVALSADGTVLAVGALSEPSGATGIDGNQFDTSAPGAGAAYLYTRASGTWAQQAYVKASNADVGDGFGLTVALSADGSMLAVGAPYESSGTSGVKPGGYADPDNGAASAGAAYVFAHANGTWTQQAYLKASNPAAGAIFGIGLALSADGSTLAVSAPGEASNATGIDGDQSDTSARLAGAAYVYRRANGDWTQQSYVKASIAGAFECFGMSLALSGDGATLAVGENCARAGSLTLSDPGAAYVYTRTSGAWAQLARVEGTDSSAAFAFSLALSADGRTLAVAQPAQAHAPGSTADGVDTVHLY